MSKQRKESTEVSVFPELIDNAHSDSFSLIIKHDYYSSDSDHGRSLLDAFISSILINHTSVASIYFIDSGVKLLSTNNDLFELIAELSSRRIRLCACLDSYQQFEVESDDRVDICFLDSIDIATEVLAIDRLHTLE